ASALLARRASGRHAERALVLALWLAPLVASAPVGEGYHYTMVLPALLVAFWWAWRLGAALHWWGWAALLLAALLMGAPVLSKSPRLGAGWLARLAYPRVYGAYLLWLVLAWMIRGAFEPGERGQGDQMSR